MSIKRALNQSSIYMLFQGIAVSVSFVTFPILTRMFSVADYGNLALANAALTLLVAFGKSGFTTSFIRYYAECGSRIEKVNLYSSSLFGIIASSASVCGLYFAVMYLFRGHVSAEMGRILVLVGCLVILKNLYNLYGSWFRAEEKVIQLSILNLLNRAGSSFGGILACIIWSRTVYMFFAGMAAVQGILALFVTIYFFKRALITISRISLRVLRPLFLYGYPLICYEVSSMLNDYSDRFMIKFFLGSVDVGLYSVGYNLAMYVQGLITTPMWMAIFPIYTKMWENDGKEKTRQFLSILLKYYCCVAILIIFEMSTLSSLLISVFATSKYSAASKVVPLVIVSVMILGTYHITGASFFLLRDTKRIAAYTLIAAAINISLNLYLIPKYGILGAAIATVISYSALAGFITVYSNKYLNLKWPLKDIGVYLVFGCIAVAILHTFAFKSDFVNLIVKSSLYFSVYSLLVLLYDPKIRSYIASWLAYLKLRSLTSKLL